MNQLPASSVFCHESAQYLLGNVVTSLKIEAMSQLTRTFSVESSFWTTRVSSFQKSLILTHCFCVGM